MLINNLKMHDRYRIEIKSNYDLKLNHRYTSYDIEMYFFIPDSLDINSYTYSKHDFYEDMQTYIRFRTPVISLEQLTVQNSETFEKVRKSYLELVDGFSKERLFSCEKHTKMLGAIIKSTLRDHVRLIDEANYPETRNKLLANYVKHVKKLKESIDTLKSEITPLNIPQAALNYYFLTDEFISLLIELRSYRLVQILEKKDNVDNKDQYLSDILAIVKDEVEYRKANSYPSIIETDGDNEKFVYRAGVLKKYTSSPLFLDTRYKKEGVFLEHTFFSLAAAISMLFATAVAYASQYAYGSFTFPLFMALILSYIFKDRIKDFLRYVFKNNLEDILYDHKLFIYTSKKESLGVNKEDVDFVKEDKVPKKVLRIRNRDPITEIENEGKGEKIFLYHKNIKIHSRRFRKYYRDLSIQDISDISRFSIKNILNKMDNPTKPLYVLDNKWYKQIDGQKVYHVNVVIRYYSKHRELFKRYRLVLSRDGIKRIESIL